MEWYIDVEKRRTFFRQPFITGFWAIIGIGEIATFIFVLLTGSQVVDRWSGFLSHISQGLFFISISVIYVSLVFVSFMFYCLFLQIIPHKRDFDYVIIHGSGLHKDGTVTQLLKDRCDKAIEVYRKDPSPPIWFLPEAKALMKSVRKQWR